MRCGELATRYTFTYAVFTPTIRYSPTNQCVCARPAGINVPLLAAALDRIGRRRPTATRAVRCRWHVSSRRPSPLVAWWSPRPRAHSAASLTSTQRCAHARHAGRCASTCARGGHTYDTYDGSPLSPEEARRRQPKGSRHSHVFTPLHAGTCRWRDGAWTRHGGPLVSAGTRPSALLLLLLLLRRPCSGTGRRPRAS